MDNSPRSPHHLFWVLQACGWITLVLFSVIVVVLLFGDVTNVLILGLFRPALSFVLSLGLWQLYRRWPAAGFKLAPHVPVIIFACLGATGLDVAITEAVRQGFAAPPIPEMAQFGATLLRLALYGVWTSFYFGLRQEMENRATAERLVAVTGANREVELQLLRAQLNPEFLLNSLNTLATAAQAGNTAGLTATTQSVSDYLRYAFNQGTRTHYAPFGGEIDAMTSYLRVEQARLGADRFDWHIEATKEARAIPAPTALLLPLVENALKHGLVTSPVPLRLTVDARVESDQLVITVENTGTWISRDPDTTKSGTALANLRRRLALLYDQHAHVAITLPPGAVRLEARLPVAGT